MIRKAGHDDSCEVTVALSSSWCSPIVIEWTENLLMLSNCAGCLAGFFEWMSIKHQKTVGIASALEPGWFVLGRST